MAVDIFMKIDSLMGESHDMTHNNEIDVLGWSWGMSNNGGSSLGFVQSFVFTKYIDKSSPQIMQATLTGKSFDNATFVVRRIGQIPLEYLTIIMTEVFISSVSTGGSSQDSHFIETVTLNFAKVKVDYREQTEDGAAWVSSTMTYNIAENTSEQTVSMAIANEAPL